MESQAKWEELNVTKDEVNRIGKALEDEQFRKMFVEYAEEIADPKNRELYEKEISQLENERGMDIQFIHPTPGHVIKLLQTNGTKSFINICQNEHIGKPAGEKKTKPDGKPGLHWSIPHSFSPPREDSDKRDNKCMVYDVVFHPDTYRMGANPAFKKMLHDTAIEGLEKQFGLEFKRDSLVKLQNMKFKGRAEATVLRKKKDENTTKSVNPDDILNKFPYPYEDGVTSEDLANKKMREVAEGKKRKEEREKQKQEANNNEISKENKDETGAIIPDYTITNQYGVDISDFGQSTSGVPLASDHRPNKLIVSIHLPLLKSAASCQLDVTERQVELVSSEPAQYKLTMKLPHPVDDENGSAKFDKTKKQLVVTLPVIRQKLNTEMNSEISNQDMTTPIVQDNPLIEEIPAKEEQSVNEQTNTQDTGHPEVTNSSIDENLPIKLDSNKIAYTFPPFTYDQDEHSVTFVLDVAYVTSCGFHTYHETNWMEMVFHTDTPTGFPSYYHIKTEFPENISAVSCNIGESNVVVNVVKAVKTDTDLWESFSASCVSSTEKEIFTFLTQSHIKKELEQLEMRAKSSEVPSNHVDGGDFVVKKKNSEHLTIDLQALPSDTSDTINNRKSPEVIHKTSPPANMQGILKQTLGTKLSRTLSESSAGDPALEMHLEVGEDLLDEDHSPRERKKSVSFSDKVEQTNFRPQSSVTEMHKTLTNRRKKQRKRQNSGGSDSSDGGRRRHSSTSEYSSGDDEGGKARNRRQRRHSSSDDQLSPRKPELNARTSSENEENEVSVADVLEEQQEELNSDDDQVAKQPNSAVNWDTNHEHVEHTKCAFDFSNSVIYDLDE